jgi:hypothetical protein
MKTIIAGSREGVTLDAVEKAVADCGWKITSVVSGTARGADRLGEEYAGKNNIPVHRFPANWEKHGKSAGVKRNTEMASNSEALVAVWDGKSRGTKHMIDVAKSMGLRVHVHHVRQLEIER